MDRRPGRIARPRPDVSLLSDGCLSPRKAWRSAEARRVQRPPRPGPPQTPRSQPGGRGRPPQKPRNARGGRGAGPPRGGGKWGPPRRPGAVARKDHPPPPPPPQTGAPPPKPAGTAEPLGEFVLPATIPELDEQGLIQ